MLLFLEKLFSWRPFGKKKRRHRSHREREERRRGTPDLTRDRRPPVPRREVIIAVLAGMVLTLIPWCFAGQSLWAQWTALFGSVLAFAFLFIPVGYDEWRSASAERSLSLLVRCPPFWIGLVLMTLMLVQGLNPRADVEIDGGFWQLMPRESVVGWLPTGIEAPMEIKGPGGMNAFRQMIIFGSAWLLFLALWCGIRSRRVIHWLVRVVLGSALFIAVFAMGMRAGGDDLLYNRVSVHVGSVYGPFLYQNQGGAFFYMAFLLATALAFREWRAAGHIGARGGSHLVLAATACVLAGAAVFSASFAAGTGVLAGLIVVLPVWWLVRPRAEAPSLRGIIATLIVVALIGSLGAAVVLFSDFKPVWQKVMYKFSLMNEAKVDDRAGMRAATWDMFNDNSRFFGSGAGSYRWVSPQYFTKYKEFLDANGMLVTRSNYAHFDWLQMLAEWGALGLFCVISLAGWGVAKLWNSGAVRNVIVWPVVAACGILMVHASFDYLFYNLAVTLLFAFMAFVALAWARESKA